MGATVVIPLVGQDTACTHSSSSPVNIVAVRPFAIAVTWVATCWVGHELTGLRGVAGQVLLRSAPGLLGCHDGIQKWHPMGLLDHAITCLPGL
jgi:hypothetical protein